MAEIKRIALSARKTLERQEPKDANGQHKCPRCGVRVYDLDHHLYTIHRVVTPRSRTWAEVR